MPIDVGDAVLTFLGNTTNLDEAFKQVQKGSAETFPPTSEEVIVLQEQIAALEAKVSQLGIQLEEAGRRGAGGMKTLSQGAREARGEIALLGEATGVTVPRHIRGFVASLPGVGKALEAAFSATAVLFLLGIIVELGSKLQSFVIDTFIFTEAMKEEQKTQIELNKQFEEHANKLKELKNQYALIGLTGPRKTAEEMSILSGEITLTTNRIAQLTQQQQDLNNRWTTTQAILSGLARSGFPGLSQAASFFVNQQEEALATSVQNLKDQAALQLKIKEEQKQQEKNLDKQKHIEELQESITFNQKKLEAEQNFAIAELGLLRHADNVHLLESGANYLALAQQEVAYQESVLFVQQDFITKKIANLKRDPTKNAAEIKALQEQSLQLEVDFNNKQLENTIKFENLRNAIIAESRTKTAKILNEIVNPVNAATTFDAVTGKITDDLQTISTEGTKAFDELQAAMDKLGLGSTAGLTQSLLLAQQGFEQLKATGVASEADLLQAQKRVLELQIQVNEAFGLGTGDLEADLNKASGAYDRLTGKIQNNQNFYDRWQRDIRTGGVSFTKTMQDIEKIGKQSLDSFAGAMENALASAILSEETFGQALAQGTAQVLAQISARATVYALYYLALGFGLLASHDFSGAANAFKSAGAFAGVAAVSAGAAFAINPSKDNNASSGGGSGTNNAASNPGQSPPGVNVPGFAGGALITQPTIAMLGEGRATGQTEGVIPLDDPAATERIAAALGGGGTRINIQGLISPDNLTKVIRKIDRQVKRNQTRLSSSNSFKNVRRA